MIFNTVLEASLRVLILLAVSESPQNAEEISVMDFLTVYADEFGIGERNLYGDNYYKYGEFAVRYEKTALALRDFSQRGLCEIVFTESGLKYKITDAGMDVFRKLSSPLASEYSEYAVLSKGEMDKYGLCAVKKRISERAKNSIG